MFVCVREGVWLCECVCRAHAGREGGERKLREGGDAAVGEIERGCDHARRLPCASYT